MKRFLTALVVVPLTLATVFWLPAPWFFLAPALFVTLGVLEFVRLGRAWVPGTPLGVLLWLCPAVAALACPGVIPGLEEGLGWSVLLAGVAVAPVGLGLLALLSPGVMADRVLGLGVLSFALPYFAAPIASLYRLHSLDPWLLFLLLVMVWLGDTAAFFVGSRFGRRKLAPFVSPNKSWEGAVASLAAAAVTAVIWSALRLDRVDTTLVALALLTNAAAQAGDLVESMIKRAAGAKDSGSLLPGHGGMLDRIDSLLFAAPVWWLGLRLLELRTGP